MTDHEPAQWPEDAERIWNAADVSRALGGLAGRLSRRFPDNQPVTVVVLMTGGMYPAVKLSRHFKRPVRFDYVHATRYRGGKTGGEIEWVRFPDTRTMTGSVLLVDDIFDEGYTMSAVHDRLSEEGVTTIVSAALAVKQHERGLARDWVDDHALVVPDRYVFGCGMDLHGYWRQLDEIWAIGP